MQNVVQFKIKPSIARLQCSRCGATTDASCNCGEPYLPAGQRAEQAVTANPEMSDRAIAEQVGVSQPTVSRARKRSTETNVSVSKKRIGRDGKARRPPKKPGPKAQVPEGFACLTDAARAGIELERAGKTQPEAVAASGLALLTYVAARDIVLLSEYKQLPAKDAAVVQQALHELNQTLHVNGPAKLIKPIALKVWGRQGHRYKTDRKRVENFCNSVLSVLTVCTTVASIEVPLLNKTQRKDAASKVGEAIGALKKLHSLISKGE